MLALGTVIAEKYRLERVLGRGGMGMVVEARHVQLGTSFALKFLYSSVLAKASLAKRFQREACAAAALKSEHVCRVFDVGTFEGTPYLVMERLEGTDLAKELRQKTRLPLRAACDYVIQACAGLAEAHAAQIVHRDLKPGNLFVTERADGTPLVKLLDFGIAKAPHEHDLELTGTDVILGSPSYMSLEQLRSSKLVDARSDIWSLGVILFELVSGRKPFVGESLADIALKIAMEPRPRLPQGPAALDDVIVRCLAHEPTQRYQSAGDLARALAPFADEPARRLAASIGRALRGASPATAGRCQGWAATPPPLPVVKILVRAAESLSAIPAMGSSALSTETAVPAVASSALSTETAVPAVGLSVPPAEAGRPVGRPFALSAEMVTPVARPAALPTEQRIVARSESPAIVGPPPSSAGGIESILPTTRMPPLARHEPSSGEIVKPAMGTTMQSSGVIENSSAVHGPSFRVRVVIIMAMGITGGILLGVVAAGVSEDHQGSAPAPATHDAPAEAAPSPPPSPPPPPPPSEPSVPVPDAAVDGPEEDSAIEIGPQPIPPAPSPIPDAPRKRRTPSPKPSKPDISKSRI